MRQTSPYFDECTDTCEFIIPFQTHAPRAIDNYRWGGLQRIPISAFPAIRILFKQQTPRPLHYINDMRRRLMSEKREQQITFCALTPFFAKSRQRRNLALLSYEKGRKGRGATLSPEILLPG